MVSLGLVGGVEAVEAICEFGLEGAAGGCDT